MSYERGEPLKRYWDRVSETEQNQTIAQLHGYVSQMRRITEDFIGGLERSPYRDDVFEGGYGDWTRYTYGPYACEENFNEGIIQALRDRMPAKVLKRKHDIESRFFNASTSYTRPFESSRATRLCLRTPIFIQVISLSKRMVRLFFWTGAWLDFGRNIGSSIMRCIFRHGGHRGSVLWSDLCHPFISCIASLKGCSGRYGIDYSKIPATFSCYFLSNRINQFS